MTGSGLTPVALVFMLVSMGAVSALAGWCLWRVLGGGRRDSADPEQGRDRS